MNPAGHHLQHLPIPVPPVLFEALGYLGQQRFFTTRWLDGAEHHPVLLSYWDGFHGENRPEDAYRLYSSHPSVAPFLADYELGTDSDSAMHLLVFDRTERAAWIGTVVDVHQFLKDQGPQRSKEGVRAEVIATVKELLMDALWETEMSFQESEEDRQ